MVKYYYAGGQRVAMRVGDGASSTVYYLLGDHLGSTSVTANSSGSKIAELRYHPWGGTRHTDGSTPTSYQYTGQRNDAGIGLYFYNARFYDPYLNRFIQADTIVPSLHNPQALNRYSYVLNSPLRYTDPSGHWYYDPGADALVATRGDDRQLREYRRNLQPPTTIVYDKPGRPVNQQSRQTAESFRLVNAICALPEFAISAAGSFVQAATTLGGLLDGPAPVADGVAAVTAAGIYAAFFDPWENALGWTGFVLTVYADYRAGYTHYDKATSELVIGQNTIEDIKYALAGQSTSLLPFGVLDLTINMYSIIDDWGDIKGEPTWESRVSFNSFQIRTKSYIVPQRIR